MKKYVVPAALAAFVCLMALLSPGKTPDARADDDDLNGEQTIFTFSVVSQAHKHPDTHQVVLSGAGKFSKKQVEGGGKFNHFIVGTTPPFTIVDQGAWKAKKFLSFTPTKPPTYGPFAAGILKMEVVLIPDGKPMVKGVTMEVVCNINAGGLQTGKAEGVTLDQLDGLTFAPSGTGITLFSPGANDD
jgi:hypothetical protein